jgi:hypothetical protein
VTTVRDRLSSEAHRDRFGRLLLVLVASFLLSGAAGGVGYRIIVAVFNLAAIVIAATATGFPSRVPARPAVVILVVFGIAATVLSPFESETAHGFGSLCTAVVVGGVLFAVLARILGHHDVEMQTIAGALCAYVLIGSLFASIYTSIDLLGSGHFFNQPMNAADYGYFSFTTLTTTGYGDITIITNFGRRLAMLEAIIGPVFLATTVARLVAVVRRDPVEDDGPPTPEP